MAVVPYVRATHSDGQSWSAAKANLLEAGCNDLSYAPAVRVTHNTTQAATSGVELTVAFNTERFDQAGNAADTMHDNSTNNSRLTCRYAGIYYIAANIQWSAAPGTGVLKIRHQGTTEIACTSMAVASGDYRNMNVSCIYALAVNEYVEVRASQTSGGGLNINNSSNISPEFMMVRVA